jgi:hypothetical protein
MTHALAVPFPALSEWLLEGLSAQESRYAGWRIGDVISWANRQQPFGGTMSLRVYAPSAIRVRGEADAAAPTGAYMERLVKLVPAEAVAVYPLLFNEARSLADPTNRTRAVALVSWIILIIVIVLRWQATATPERGAQWLAVSVAAVSYIIWVYVFGGQFGVEGLLQPWLPALSSDPAAPPDPDMAKFKNLIGSLALVCWTLVVPAVYRGDSR